MSDMLYPENIPSVFSEQFDPRSLINDMKDHFPGRFEKVLQVWERYTLEQHTVMVLGQFEKYFAHKPLPAGITNAHFRLFLAFHDLGKPDAESNEHTNNQAKCNVSKFDEYFPGEPFIGEEQRDILRSLLMADPIGLYIKGRFSLEESETLIRLLRPANTTVSESDYFRLFLTYYMCDAGSYTVNAGGKKSLDSLFSFGDREMRFSEETHGQMAPLMARFMNVGEGGVISTAHQSWAEYYDFIYETEFGEIYHSFTAITIESIREYLPTGTIIDYGAGTGRITIPLKQAGYDVIAVEPCTEMANVLKEKAEKAGVEIPVHVCSASGYVNGQADMALCVFTVLNYITGDQEMKQSLGNMVRHLKPGGLLFLDLPNDIFFSVGVVIDFSTLALQRFVTCQPKAGNVYTYTESTSGFMNGRIFEFTDEFPLRKWSWEEVDGILDEHGMVSLPDSFGELHFTNARYKMYRKE
jgi:SAM-dependent methyltransferase